MFNSRFEYEQRVNAQKQDLLRRMFMTPKELLFLSDIPIQKRQPPKRGKTTPQKIKDIIQEFDRDTGIYTVQELPFHTPLQQVLEGMGPNLSLTSSNNERTRKHTVGFIPVKEPTPRWYMLISHPMSDQEKKQFSTLEQLVEGKDNQARLDAINPDNFRRNAPYHDAFDAKELLELQRADGLHKKIQRNSETAVAWFSHLATLAVSGSYSNRGALSRETFVKTPYSEKAVLVGAYHAPESPESIDSVEILFEDTQYLAGTIGEGTVFDHPEFKQRLDYTTVIDAMNKFGTTRVLLRTTPHGVDNAAAAYEALVSAVAEAVTGDVMTSKYNCVDRVKLIADALDAHDVLDPLLDLYMHEEHLSSSQLRGSATHAGGKLLRGRADLDSWGRMYFEDAGKTLLSVVAQKPVLVSDFDLYARRNGLSTQEDPVATLPAHTAKHYLK